MGSEPEHAGRGEATAAWLAVTAPGALVTCGMLALGLNIGPLLVPGLVVGETARTAAAGVLALQAVATLVASRGSWGGTAALLGCLAIHAALCAVAAATQPWAPSPVLLIAVLIVSLESAGWLGAAVTMAGAALGLAAALWGGMTYAAFFEPSTSFPTTLEVDTAFAGAVVLAPAAPAFATTLTVEPTFAGRLVAGAADATFPVALAVETSLAGAPAVIPPQELLIPALTLALVALSLGLATSWFWVRRARSAVAASILAAARAAS
jgi:hypothetical protein